MVLDPSCNSVPFLVERAPADPTTTTNPVLSPSSNLFSDRPSDAGPLSPILLTSQSSNTSSSTGSQPTNEVLGSSQVSTSSQAFTTSGATTSQANMYPSNAGNGYLQQAVTTSPTPVSIGSGLLPIPTPSSLSSSSSITNSGSTGASTGPSSSTLLWSSLTTSSDNSSSGSSSPITTYTPLPLSSTPTMTSNVSSTSTAFGSASSSAILTIPLSVSSSFPAIATSTSTVVSTSAPTNPSSSTDPSSSSDTAFTFSSSPVLISGSTIIPTTLISTTKVDKYSTTLATTPSVSTLILTSILPGHQTTTWTTTTSGVLSTAVVDTAGDRLSRSPGSIAGLILGVLGAIAFAVLWLFCARRRQRKLSRDASAIPPWAPGGPLDAEVDMEERYAGIIAALNAGMGAGRNARIEGDTSGEVSGEMGMAHASSPTLPRYSLPGEDNDGPHVFPLSPPPPPSAYCSPPPPSAYVPPGSNSSRRRSSPGPDASAWFGGYSVAPAPSAASHYSHSTSHFLTRTETGTRTRTGSEEPLLTRAGSGSSYLDSGNNKVRLGSAFGSPEGSMNSHNLSPTSPSSGMRSATTSSFDVLRSISSQGALRSTSSHGYGFGFGSTSSGTGSHQGPTLGLAISAAPNSYTSRRVTRWKKGKRESTGSSSTVSASASGSVGEKPAGVRAFLDRLRRGNTPSPKTDFLRELPRDMESEGAAEKMNTYGPNSLQTFSAVVSPATPEPASVPTSPRFVLSNPDPRPHSPYVHVDMGEHEDGLQPPTWPWLTGQSTLLPPFGPHSPAPTDESRLTTADGLLDPRLRDPVEGRSNSSLRDFEDYSRPIGGLINNRMHSTTTFGTVDIQDFDSVTSVQNREDDQQEDDCATTTQTPRASWIIDGGAGAHAQ